MTRQWKYSLRMGITGAAVSLVAHALNISVFGLMWMAIAAFMVLDIRTSSSLRMGVNRILGTVSGALLAILLALLFYFHSLIIVMLCFIVIGIVSAILYHYEKSIRLMAMTAGIIYLLIIANSNNHDFIWKIALDRSFDNIVAVIITMIIAYFVLPISSQDELARAEQQLFDIFSKICKQIKDLFQLGSEADYKNLIKQAQDCNLLVKKLSEERYFEMQYSRVVKMELVKNKLQLAKLQCFICELPQNDLILQNPLLKLLQQQLALVFVHLEDLFKTIKVSQPHFPNIMLEPFNQALDIVLSDFEKIRQQIIIPTFKTEDVKNFYQFITTLQLIQNNLLEMNSGG